MIHRISPGTRCGVVWRPRHNGRPGKIMVLFLLLLPALLGILGLVLDGGLMMAAQRQTQNAADAAATAAALDLLHSKSLATLQSTANTYAQTYNGLTNAAVTVHNPPQSGPYQGNSQYVEVYVSYPVSTLFIQVLGVNPSQTVTARAVAGYEPVTAGEGTAVLDPNANPGLEVKGGGSLTVTGRVTVNATAEAYAAKSTNNSTVKARIIDVVGNVNIPSNFQPLNAGDPSPLQIHSLSEPDPLINLPTPKSGDAGFSTTTRTDPKVTTGQVVTLSPGVYNSITINGGTVSLMPGIYVLRPTKSAGNGSSLTINGGTVQTINSNGSIPTVGSDGTVSNLIDAGVLFYNTSTTYQTDGSGDGNGSSSSGANPQGSYGAVSIGGNGSMTLLPLNQSGGAFNGMLLYQSRGDATGIGITGNGTQTRLMGTLYAKWANFSVSGGGQYFAQFIAGSMTITGTGSVTINYEGKKLGKANEVFLVE